MILSICKYIQSMDKNSDIMDMYEELMDDAVDFETMIETLQNILGDWKEDLKHGQFMTKRVQAYYDYLGI